MPEPTQRTPLYDWHLQAGAKMMPFGGYDMPLQYSGIVEEHHATRRGCTLFDTCHMGEIDITGSNSVAFLERMVSCPVATIPLHRCRYGLLCNRDGGVIDDLIIYRRGNTHFMLVVNAGTRPGDLEWLTSHLPDSGVTLTDISDTTAKIDIQGPTSATLLQQILPPDTCQLGYYHFTTCTFKGADLIVSRTGYTGERGFECYGPADAIRELWQTCITQGATPAGLGARDTLRLEAGYPLYGHELTTKRLASESGFTKSIDLSKEFLGSEALTATLPHDQLVGLRLAGRRTARAGDALVLTGTDEVVGVVTSGSFGPSVEYAVALAYCSRKTVENKQELEIAGKRTRLACQLATPPFYTNGTVRAPLPPVS